MQLRRVQRFSNALLLVGLLHFLSVIVFGKWIIPPIFYWLVNTFSLDKQVAINIILTLWFGGTSLWLLVGLSLKLILNERSDNFWGIPRENVFVKVGDLTDKPLLLKFGLKSGDIVLKANGETLESLNRLSNWWVGEDKIRLTVMRDNQELEVVLKKEEV